jgi:hypothetical protein
MSDLGNYSYAPPGSPLPHAVTAVSGGSISTTFAYDPNGNQTSGLGRTISYASYNKPASITLGARTISFLDDTDHQRFKQVTPEGATLYIAAFGVLAELSSPGASGLQFTDPQFNGGRPGLGRRRRQIRKRRGDGGVPVPGQRGGAGGCGSRRRVCRAEIR